MSSEIVVSGKAKKKKGTAGGGASPKRLVRGKDWWAFEGLSRKRVEKKYRAKGTRDAAEVSGGKEKARQRRGDRRKSSKGIKKRSRGKGGPWKKFHWKKGGEGSHVREGRGEKLSRESPKPGGAANHSRHRRLLKKTDYEGKKKAGERRGGKGREVGGKDREEILTKIPLVTSLRRKKGPGS